MATYLSMKLSINLTRGVFVYRIFLVFFVYLTIGTYANPSLPFDCLFDARYETIMGNKNNKRIFIETGTAGGCGVAIADQLGFEIIHSIELTPHRYADAHQRLGHLPHVHLYLGDSATVLRTLLPEIQEPAFFWLDAHYNPGGDKWMNENCPLIRELEVIASHHLNTHTILIDDVRCFETTDFDNIVLDTVIALLKQINPNYEITFEDGFQEGDVLVARLPCDHH